MQVIKIADAPKIERPGTIMPDTGVNVQRLLRESTKEVWFTVANFSPGVENQYHVHHHEQVVLVLSGKGIAATKTEEHVVQQGELVFIPEGEVHRHAAPPDSPCSLLSIHIPPPRPVETVE
jgi:quercetin dioxygenase-like cupin family protein